METETATQQNLLDDIQYQLVQASGSKRFANLFIDRILFVGVIFGASYVMASSGTGFLDYFDSNDVLAGLIDRLLTAILFALFVFSFEVVTKGKTIGKYITGTRAVKQDGTMITAREALLRALSRMVPFEIFSALGSPCYPWHDKWSGTYVVDEKLSNYQKQ